MFCISGLITVVLISVKIYGYLLEEKLHFEILGLSFPSKLDCLSYNVSITKNLSKKLGALICFMTFLSPEDALYFHVPFSLARITVGTPRLVVLTAYWIEGI